MWQTSSMPWPSAKESVCKAAFITLPHTNQHVLMSSLCTRTYHTHCSPLVNTTGKMPRLLPGNPCPSSTSVPPIKYIKLDTAYTG
mmetsp:Transcript_8169/g.13211  ORF Transcript_8169/g.13211 Transcript_8169/m.13211 type:complete len:85 (-) Transcript_8169:2426-2680(-)